jgi:hypothetical protein
VSKKSKNGKKYINIFDKNMNSKFSAFHVHIDTLIIMVSDFDIGGVNLLGKALWF